MPDYTDEATVSTKTAITSLEEGYDEAKISSITTVYSTQEWTVYLVSKDYFGNPLTAEITYNYDSSAVAGSVGPNDTDDGRLA